MSVEAANWVTEKLCDRRAGVHEWVGTWDLEGLSFFYLFNYLFIL